MSDKNSDLRQNWEPPDDGDEIYRDYDPDEVPQPPNDDDYVPSDELPQSEIEHEEARKSVQRAEEAKNPQTNKLGEGVGDLKGAAIEAGKNKVAKAIPGSERVEEAAENVEKASSFTRTMISDAKNMLGVVKGAFAFLANPATLISLGVVVVVAVLVISTMAIGQVYGQTKTTSTAEISAGAMQQRLAQRAEWLQHNYRDYGNAGQLIATAPGPKSNVAGNAWVAACPDIVALIYGLSPYLTGYNGVKNAYQNYKNHPDMYEAWAFASGAHGDGSSSPGASLQDPPPGAIVSIENDSGWYATCCPGAGHTFVMLTDELVIDNFSGGGILQGTPGGGPRILNDTMRSHIVGWALPKGEGFEGTFITGSFEGAAENAPEQDALPNLPPVPTYMGDVVIPGDSGGSTFNGPKERADWMRAAGIAESDWGYVDYIAQKESSWNPKATNPSSGACGLIQALPCSKVPGDGYDPVDNLRWADGYAKSRYGSWEAAYEFWVANHWW